MRISRLPLNVVVVGEDFTTEHFQNIKEVHGRGGEINIKPMKFFSGPDSLKNFVEASQSFVYLIHGVDAQQVKYVISSGKPFGDFTNKQPIWYNITSLGSISPIEDVIALNIRRRGSYCGQK